MDAGEPPEGSKPGAEESSGYQSALLVWAIVGVMMALMLYILFAPLLGIPENRKRSAEVAAFGRTAREAPLRQVSGRANWQTNRFIGRSRRYNFQGFDFYLPNGKWLRFSCLGEDACPPSGQRAVKLPDAVRVSYVQTSSGYLLPIEIRDMAGKVIISRAAALAQIDRRAQWEQAHPYDPAGDRWLFATFALIFAGLGWRAWRDYRADKDKAAEPV